MVQLHQHEMNMGEAPLLDLYHIDIRHAWDMLVGQHLFQRLQFGPEHSGHEIWLVLQDLARKQIVLFVVAVWVASHHREYLRLVVHQ